jgi:hypothetical protein
MIKIIDSKLDTNINKKINTSHHKRAFFFLIASFERNAVSEGLVLTNYLIG